MVVLLALIADVAMAQVDSLSAEDRQNPFIQLRGHVLRGIELENNRQLRAALNEYREGIRICERLNLYERYADQGKHWIYLFTMPVYTFAATVSDRLGEAEQAVSYCDGAIGWIERCDSVRIREQYGQQVCLTMLKHRRLSAVHSLAVRTYDDACKLGRHDDALICATLLMETEDAKFKVSPADNPWIARGREHYNHAKLVEAKTLYLTFLRKAYIKANMTDKALQMERQLRAAMGRSTRLTEAGDIVPLDTSALSKRLLPQDQPTLTSLQPPQTPPKGEDSLSLGEAGASEKIRYIYEKHYGGVIATGTLLVVVALMFVVYAIRQRRMRTRAKREAELEQNRKYLEGMETERSRMAKELHDGVGNQLLAIEMKLNENEDETLRYEDEKTSNLQPHTSDLRPHTSNLKSQTSDLDARRQARRMLTESREQVRRVSHELMPPEFTHAHLGEVLRDYIGEMDGTGGIAFHLDSQMEEACYREIPPTDALEIYRIIQEAVVNAVKHANPADIYVLIKDEGEDIMVRITNDNANSNEKNSNLKSQTSHPNGIGLRTMRQRAEAIGATLKIERIPLATVVTLRYVKKK